MRALTLTQPWAGLVASGIKLVENREQPVMRRDHFGVPFAIHASRVIDYGVYDRIEEIAPDLNWCRPRHGSCDLVREHSGGHWTVGCHGGALPPHAPLSWAALSRITGAIIAVTAVTKCIRSAGVSARYPGTAHVYREDDLKELGADQKRWLFGRYGYVVATPWVLPQPVPCRGFLGLWTVPEGIESKIYAR